MGKMAELWEEEQRRKDRTDTRMYEEDKMLNNPEFSKIIDEATKDVESDVDQIFTEVIRDLRVRLRKLNDDDCYKLTTKLKSWFIKNVYN